MTFKHTLRGTLERLAAGEWKVQQGAKFVAEQDVPDDLWQIFRLRDHKLTTKELLEHPLGLLAETIGAEILSRAPPKRYKHLDDVDMMDLH